MDNCEIKKYNWGKPYKCKLKKREKEKSRQPQ